MSKYKGQFVVPKVVRLPLNKDGKWIEVKERLSAGEMRRMSGAAFTDVAPTMSNQSAKIGVDFATLGLARSMAYLVDWNFEDHEGRPVKCTPQAIEALDEDWLKLIEDALDKHLSKMDAEKKARNGAPTPRPASPSAGSSAGRGTNTKTAQTP